MRRSAEFSIASNAGSLDRYSNRRAGSMTGMTARQSSPIAVPIQLTLGTAEAILGAITIHFADRISCPLILSRAWRTKSFLTSRPKQWSTPCDGTVSPSRMSPTRASNRIPESRKHQTHGRARVLVLRSSPGIHASRPNCANRSRDPSRSRLDLSLAPWS
jgi:hypothetical protein